MCGTNLIKIGYRREYPTGRVTPLFGVICPECGKPATRFGEVVEILPDGTERFLCIPCGTLAYPPEER